MKFLLGVTMGVVLGMLTLISTIAAFIAGLALGMKHFDDKLPTTEEETPAT